MITNVISELCNVIVQVSAEVNMTFIPQSEVTLQVGIYIPDHLDYIE